MNKQKALAILKEQRDSFLYDADVSQRNDFTDWCKGKADDFQAIIDWIEEEHNE